MSASDVPDCNQKEVNDLSTVYGILDSRSKDLPANLYSYKLAPTQYGLDVIAVSPTPEIDESRMAAWVPYADGNRRDGVGDLLEVGGIDFERHRRNPIALFDHGKHVVLPLGLTTDPETGEYCAEVDQVNKTARDRVFFYQGKGMSGVSADKEYDHAVFCSQVFDLWAKKFIRGGSIGYQVMRAVQLAPDYETGTPQGLHLLKVRKLESSVVVMPANQDTVGKSFTLGWEGAREILCMGGVCGKPLHPVLVKSFTALAPPKKAMMGWEGKGATKDVAKKLAKVGAELAKHTDPAPMPGYGQIFTNEGEVWYVGGDGDENGFSKVVEQKIRDAYPGVTKITIEAESFPPDRDSWVQAYPPKDEKHFHGDDHKDCACGCGGTCGCGTKGAAEMKVPRQPNNPGRVGDEKPYGPHPARPNKAPKQIHRPGNAAGGNVIGQGLHAGQTPYVEHQQSSMMKQRVTGNRGQVTNEPPKITRAEKGIAIGSGPHGGDFGDDGSEVPLDENLTPTHIPPAHANPGYIQYMERVKALRQHYKSEAFRASRAGAAQAQTPDEPTHSYQTSRAGAARANKPVGRPFSRENQPATRGEGRRYKQGEDPNRHALTTEERKRGYQTAMNPKEGDATADPKKRAHVFRKVRGYYRKKGLHGEMDRFEEESVTVPLDNIPAQKAIEKAEEQSAGAGVKVRADGRNSRDVLGIKAIPQRSEARKAEAAKQAEAARAKVAGQVATGQAPKPPSTRRSATFQGQSANPIPDTAEQVSPRHAQQAVRSSTGHQMARIHKSAPCAGCGKPAAHEAMEQGSSKVHHICTDCAVRAHSDRTATAPKKAPAGNNEPTFKLRKSVGEVDEKILRHEGGKWVLHSRKHPGRVLGRHDTKEEALAQERAIEAHKSLRLSYRVKAIPDESERANSRTNRWHEQEAYGGQTPNMKQQGIQPASRAASTELSGTARHGAGYMNSRKREQRSSRKPTQLAKGVGSMKRRIKDLRGQYRDRNPKGKLHVSRRGSEGVFSMNVAEKDMKKCGEMAARLGLKMAPAARSMSPDGSVYKVKLTGGYDAANALAGEYGMGKSLDLDKAMNLDSQPEHTPGHGVTSSGEFLGGKEKAAPPGNKTPNKGKIGKYSPAVSGAHHNASQHVTQNIVNPKAGNRTGGEQVSRSQKVPNTGITGTPDVAENYRAAVPQVTAKHPSPMTKKKDMEDAVEEKGAEYPHRKETYARNLPDQAGTERGSLSNETLANSKEGSEIPPDKKAMSAMAEGSGGALVKPAAQAKAQPSSKVSPEKACLLPGQEIQGRVTAASKAWYSGDAVVIRTSAGNRLSVTANHPVLTEVGFVSAGSITEGDNLLCYVGKNKTNPPDGDVQHTPMMVEEIYESFCAAGCEKISSWVSGLDFHGDAAFFDGGVEIVRSDCSLRNDRVTDPTKRLNQSRFTGKSKGKTSLTSRGGPSKVLRSLLFATTCSMSRRDDSSSLVVGHQFPFDLVRFGAVSEDTEFSQVAVHNSATDSSVDGDLGGGFASSVITKDCAEDILWNRNRGTFKFHGFGLGSELNVPLSEFGPDRTSASTILFSQLRNVFPSKIIADEVIDVERFHYDGPVYDFQSPLGYILVERLVVSNCQILEDGEANGHPLTEKQRGMFGAACGRGKKSLRQFYREKAARQEHVSSTANLKTRYPKEVESQSQGQGGGRANQSLTKPKKTVLQKSIGSEQNRDAEDYERAARRKNPENYCVHCGAEGPEDHGREDHEYEAGTPVLAKTKSHKPTQGGKSMEVKNKAAELPSGGDIEAPLPEDGGVHDEAPEGAVLPEEPFGAQLSRRIHADHMHLMQEYHAYLEHCEDEGVRKMVEKILTGFDATMTGIEQFFTKHERYKELPPLEGGMDEDEEEGETPADEIPEEEVEEEGEAAPDMDSDEVPAEAEGGDAEEELEEPTPEEAVEGMSKEKSLTPEMKKALVFYRKAHGVCPKCGEKPCACGNKEHVKTNYNHGDGANSIAYPDHHPKGKDGEALGVGGDHVPGAEAIQGSEEPIKQHHRAILDEAAGYLGKLATDPEFSEQHRLDAYHYHRGLESVLGETEEAAGAGDIGDFQELDSADTSSEVQAGGKAMDNEGVGPAEEGADMGVEGEHLPGAEEAHEYPVVQGFTPAHRDGMKKASGFFRKLAAMHPHDFGHPERAEAVQHQGALNGILQEVSRDMGLESSPEQVHIEGAGGIGEKSLVNIDDVLAAESKMFDEMKDLNSRIKELFVTVGKN